MNYLKTKTPRAPGYLRFVAQHDCFACGISGLSQAAHPNYGRGLGQKASDLDAFPLCCTRPGILGCHAEHDRLIGMTLGQRREFERLYTACMQDIARQAGRPEFKECTSP